MGPDGSGASRSNSCSRSSRPGSHRAETVMLGFGYTILDSLSGIGSGTVLLPDEEEN